MKGMASNLKLFAEAAQEIPNAGGFMGDFLGTVDLPTFSNQIHGLISTFGTVDQAQLKNCRILSPSDGQQDGSQH